MSEYRFSTIPGMPPQFDVRSDAEKWKGAQEQTQAALREQGQMASAALSNNAQLWESNKKLRRMLEEAENTSRTLNAQVIQLRTKIDAIPLDVRERADLQNENERLTQENAFLKHELAASMYPELSTEQRRAYIKQLQEQEQEISKLAAQGLVPTVQGALREDQNRNYGPPRSEEERKYREESIARTVASGAAKGLGLPTEAEIAGRAAGLVGSEGC